MADLDDFFAKKDRKRNKQAKKQAAADEPRSNNQTRADEPRRESGQGHKDKPESEASDNKQQNQLANQEEDEWREVEVAKKADYTGLKIQHLTPGQENFQPEGSNGGTSNTINEQKSKGPWNKVQEAVETKVEEKEPPPPSEVVIPPPPASKSYVAPVLRNRPPGSSMDGPPLRYNRYYTQKPSAPDINNEEFFPVLGESRKGGHHSSGGGQWSEASRGIPPSSRMPPSQVSLGNRYTSLSHDS